MPKMDGIEALTRIKNTKGIRRIPIIILSSSNLESDIDNSFDSGANSYLVKPDILKDLQDMMEITKKFWMDTAELSGGENG